MAEYKLYVGNVQQIPQGIEYSYYNNQHQYLLLFTDQEVNKDVFYEVHDELLDKLNKHEKEWLSRVKITVNAKYVSEHKDEIIDLLEEFVTRYEKELEKEKLKADGTK